MREDLLQFIWKHRYYNHRDLTTGAGVSLFIHYPGDPNTDQGPDFTNARITIGYTTLEGPVELHVRTSDFVRHRHSGDPHYNRVILHVVWINDMEEPPAGIPVLSLVDRIPVTLVPRFQKLMDLRSFVPCASLLAGRGPGNWAAFRDRLLHRRLEFRAAFIRTLTDENNPHWEEVLFQLIARSMGQPANTDAFLAIARSLPLKDLLRRRDDPEHLAHLFFEKSQRLQLPLSLHRMRPAHSPQVRFRQLAALVKDHSGRFTLLLESDHPGPILRSLAVEGLGMATRRSILINAFIPLLYAYAALRQEPSVRNKTFRWLHAMPPEDNHIIRKWRSLDMAAKSAADTQALLELRKSLCLEKKCLDCAIGRSLFALPVAAPALSAATASLKP